MHITIECLGASQRWCGAQQIDLDMKEPATVKMVIDLLAQRFPEFASRRTVVAVAIGSAIVKDGYSLKQGDHIVLIPPVSGG
jgi:molybdopterin converting factor small subunit